MEDNLKLNVGVIGLGVGFHHVTTYLSNPNCKLIAVCDFNEEKLRDAATRLDPAVLLTTDPGEILTHQNINLVSVASWDNFHTEQILLGLAHGKHLFVEKPLCVSDEEAIQIWTALKRHAELKIGTNLILRLSPRFLELKERILAGEIGDLISIEGDYNYGRLRKIVKGWRGEIKGYSGVLGGGVHIIDLMLWLTGRKILEVAAFGGKVATHQTSFQNYDLVTAILRFEGGLVGKMSVNLGCVYPHFHQFSLYGTAATFENNIESAYLYRNFDNNEGKLQIQYDREAINLPHPGTPKGAYLEKFIESLVNNTTVPIKPEEIFNSLSVCFAIEKAVHSGKSELVHYYGSF